MILSGNQAFMARVYLSWLPQVPLLSTDLCIFGFLSSSAMSTFKSTVIVSHCFIWDQKNTGALDVKLQSGSLYNSVWFCFDKKLLTEIEKLLESWRGLSYLHMVQVFPFSTTSYQGKRIKCANNRLCCTIVCEMCQSVAQL